MIADPPHFLVLARRAQWDEADVDLQPDAASRAAPQLELLEEHPELPGLNDGMERVLRDERWHVGFGGRCLQDQGLGRDDVAGVLREGKAAALAWAESRPRRSSRCSGGASGRLRAPVHWVHEESGAVAVPRIIAHESALRSPPWSEEIPPRAAPAWSSSPSAHAE